MELKYFSLVMRGNVTKEKKINYNFLWTGFSKDIIKAFERAKKAANRDMELINVKDWEIVAWKCNTKDELKIMSEDKTEENDKSIVFKIDQLENIKNNPKKNIIQNKRFKTNQIMMEIINKKSRYLLNKHKSLFNEKEIIYLRDRLKKKKHV